MKELPLIFSLLLAFISCCYNPCTDYGEGNFGANPRIHSINFSPKQAKVGDTVTMIIEKDNWNLGGSHEFNNRYEVTNEGKIKYIGGDSPIYDFHNGEEMEPITKILPTKEDKENLIKVTEYVSILSKSINTSEGACQMSDCIAVSDKPVDYDGLKQYYPGYQLVTISFKVPANAKSGYIYTTTPDHFAEWSTSDEKLIVVDDDGNEIN